MGRRERGTLTVHSECEETPGEEAGLWAERPEGDSQVLCMAGPSLGMSAEGSASHGPQASPIPSSPGLGAKKPTSLGNERTRRLRRHGQGFILH